MPRPRLSLLAAIMMSVSPTAWSQPLEISGRHLLQIEPETEILIEGVAVDPLDALLAPGMKLLAIEGDAARGVAAPLTLVFDFDLRGIVTGLDPVRVFGTPLAISPETTLVGWTAPDQIAIGDALVVSGQFDVNGSLAAGFLERLPAPTNTWRLAGYVDEVGAGGLLRIGDQLLDSNGIVPTGCAATPAVGDFLIVRADAIPGFVAGQTLDTVTRIACAQPAPLGTPGAAGGLEGVVDALPAPDEFLMEGLRILHGPETLFGNGSVEDLEPGILVELEGTFVDASTVQADVVEFVRPIVRIEGPAGPADVVPGQSITLLGLTTAFDPQTRDDDGIAVGGLAAPSQVQVRGWIDRDGGLHATRVRERGDPDPLDLTLRGPIADLAPPAFTIAGHPVDSALSTFADEFGTPLTSKEFFALVADSDIVEIGAARYDIDGETLIGGTVILIGPVGARTPRGTAPARLLFGPVTLGLFPERIFDSDFE